MIRFSHEANSWQFLIDYAHYPNLNHWVNVHWKVARNLCDRGYCIINE